LAPKKKRYPEFRVKDGRRIQRKRFLACRAE
jgi:hypothetical protein